MYFRNRFNLFVAVLLILTVVLTSCQTPPPATESAVASETAPIKTEQPTSPPAPSVPSETPAADITPEPLNVAFVLPGPINDGSFSSQAYNGILNAEKELGIKASYIESVAVPDSAKIIRDYAAEGYDVVWAHSGAFLNSTLQVAPEFPDITFVTLAGPGMDFPENAWISGNEFEDAYFLAGALAGMMSQTKKLGYVGGVEIPIYAAAAKAFEAGAKYINPEITVYTSFTGDFNDPTAARQAATGQIENDADIIAHSLNLGAFGLFEAARQANQSGKKIWIIGKDIDQHPIAPDVVLTSIVLDFQETMVRILSRVAAGEKGGYLAVNLTEGTAYLAPFYGQVPTDVEARINEIREKIIAGEIDYPTQADLQ